MIDPNKRPLISRRTALLPISAALPAAALVVRPALGHGAVAPPAPAAAPLPDRYDEPLGIGLETWPYPSGVRWQACSVAGQPLRMAFMDVAPTGTNRNKTVVLLHGKNFDSSYWAGPIKDLSAAGFRVIVPDQIGFNKSSKPDMTYSLDILAGLTINLLRGLVLNKFALVGHSFGGMLAVRIAATYPNQVEKVVLESPIGLVDYRRFIPPQSLDTLVAAERRRTLAAYRGFVQHFFAAMPPKDAEPFVAWRMRLAQSGEYDRFCKATALIYQMIYQEQIRDQFDDMQCPGLVIVGDKDQSAPLKQYASPEMAAKMPSIPAAAPDAVKDMKKGKLVVLPGVGHVPHLEAPEVFRKAVVEFLVA